MKSSRCLFTAHGVGPLLGLDTMSAKRPRVNEKQRCDEGGARFAAHGAERERHCTARARSRPRQGLLQRLVAVDDLADVGALGAVAAREEAALEAGHHQVAELVAASAGCGRPRAAAPCDTVVFDTRRLSVQMRDGQAVLDHLARAGARPRARIEGVVCRLLVRQTSTVMRWLAMYSARLRT